MPQTNPESVTFELVKYLAGEGFSITPAKRAEIEARVLGHQSAFSQSTYERRAQAHLVLELDLEDCAGAFFGSITLNKTLARMPFFEGSERAEAMSKASEFADKRGRPMVVVDGNYEGRELVDPSTDVQYAAYRLNGEILDRDAKMLAAGAVSESFSLVDACINTLRHAAGTANHFFAQQPPEGSARASGMVVVNQDTHEILYRLVR
jgi:hypothetical protein